MQVKRSDPRDYSYFKPQEWGFLKSDYKTCWTGLKQAPINLRTAWGYSKNHIPEFNYPSQITGSLENSGSSLTYNIDLPDNLTTLPSMSFQEDEDSESEEVYLINWHLHAPSEHTIDGEHAHSEMHFVHTLADGETVRSVVAFLVEDAEETTSNFISQLPRPFPDNDKSSEVTMDLGNLELSNFWTYEGSLTTPPCTQGVRWFVSKERMFVSYEDLEQILGVSTFSARPTNPLWDHNVNV